MTDSTDSVLIERVAGGDRVAFAALYDRYAPRLLGLVVKILGIRGEAEDVLQETFLQVWSSAGRFDPTRSPPDVWLLLLARSRALDRLRRRVAATGPAGTDPCAADAPPAEAARRDEAGRARSAVAGLPADQRLAVELAFFQGLTHEQIAAKVGAPLGTVKTRIRLGLTRLRARLAPPADGPPK